MTAIYKMKVGGIGFIWFSFIIIFIAFPAALFDADYSNAQPSLCGDPNGDGIVSIGDAVTIIDYIFRGSGLPAQSDMADVNCNGGIDIGDAVYLIDHIFRNGPAPCSDCPPIAQYVLFEICYSNFAWAPTLKGLYITSDGYAIEYEYDHDQVVWPQPQWYEEYTEWELMYRYSHHPELCRTIPPDELYAMYQLVAAAGEGPLSGVALRCYDFGEVYFVAYIYDAVDGIYQPVLLELAGDAAQKNLAPEAEQLVQWLMMCGWDNIPCRY